jgi:hypothetical protein
MRKLAFFILTLFSLSAATTPTFNPEQKSILLPTDFLFVHSASELSCMPDLEEIVFKSSVFDLVDGRRPYQWDFSTLTQLRRLDVSAFSFMSLVEPEPEIILYQSLSRLEHFESLKLPKTFISLSILQNVTLPSLKEIYYVNPKLISGQWDKYIYSLNFSLFAPHLTRLDLVGPIHFGGLTEIAELRELTHLNLSGCEFYSDLKAELKWLQLPSLTHWNLSRTACSGIPFDTFTPFLKEINLSRTNVKGGDIQSLSKIASLEVIDLTDTKITKSAISHLSKLHNLKKLDLKFNLLAGGAFDKLKNLPYLEELNLSGCGLDRDDLQKLHEVTQLKTLNLQTGTNYNVRPQDIEELKAALPNTEVIW